MPKFSIKDLLIAMTLIGVGLGETVVSRPVTDPYMPVTHAMLTLPAHLGGWIVVGIGVLYPFKMSYLGAFLGLVVGMAVVAALR